MGRRGPVQASFTAAEIEELAGLEGVSLQVDPKFLELDEENRSLLEGREATVPRRAFHALARVAEPPGTPAERIIEINFFRSPLELFGGERVEGVEVGLNCLAHRDGVSMARSTGEKERVACGLVIQCIGYRGLAMSGVPFDNGRGIVPNHSGRIDGMRGAYVAGWLKHGPRGLIGNNRKESADTVKSLIGDLGNLPQPVVGPEDVHRGWVQRGVRLTSFDDWLAIDQKEIALGREGGKPREKFVRVEDMLSHLVPE